MRPKLIEFIDISKRFGGTLALKSVSLDIHEGEIVALLGENGAGKSTLIKTLAGIHKRDQGTIRFRGEDYHHRPPRPNQPQKVAFIHQDLGLIEWMTVAENVGMAQGFSRRISLIDWQDTERRAERALALAETTPQELVDLIVGRPAHQMFAKSHWRDGPERLRVENLTCGSVGPVRFEARSGELLGLVGLRGAGQEAVGRALFGTEAFDGLVWLDGKRLDLSSVGAALAAGVGLIARDRTEESVALSLSVRENMYLNPSAVGRGLFSFMKPARESELTRELGARLGLRPNDPHLPIEALSGGNQQKVVVGRWLATGRKLLIAEDPTAGVDVGAKAEIYRLIAAAVEAGLAVIVVSTDFEEVAHICHRALVFSHNRIVRELAGDALTTAALISAASVSEAA
ncbi:MAG: sugar ABC transporter ATP-binding protein [Mesorhizobium sp.]|nr:MAG: sugar ABC transporter ATP-binding protein [Mesorhizobium sp.]